MGTLIIVDEDTGETREATWLQALEICVKGLQRVIADGQETPDTAYRIYLVQMILDQIVGEVYEDELDGDVPDHAGT